MADDSRIINVGENGRFAGWGIVFDTPILSWWPTVFRPEGDDPFNLEGRDPSEIKVLWQHSWSEPIGVYEVLEIRDEGLWVEGIINATGVRAEQARDTISKQIIDGLSIGMDDVLQAIWEEDSDFVWTDGKPLNDMLRVLQRVNLIEVSPVTFPANLEARIEQYHRWATGAEPLPTADTSDMPLSTIRSEVEFMRDLARAHCVPLDRRLHPMMERLARGGALEVPEDPDPAPADGGDEEQRTRMRQRVKIARALTAV